MTSNIESKKGTTSSTFGFGGGVVGSDNDKSDTEKDKTIGGFGGLEKKQALKKPMMENKPVYLEVVLLQKMHRRKIRFSNHPRLILEVRHHLRLGLEEVLSAVIIIKAIPKKIRLLVVWWIWRKNKP